VSVGAEAKDEEAAPETDPEPPKGALEELEDVTGSPARGAREPP
jgi:hypothetical protein